MRKYTFTKCYSEVLSVAGRLAKSEGSDCVNGRHLWWGCIGAGGKIIFNKLLGRRHLLLQDVMRLPDVKSDAEGESNLPLSSDVWKALSIHGGTLESIMEEAGQTCVDAPHVAAALICSEGAMSELLSINGICLEAERPLIIKRLIRMTAPRKNGANRETARKTGRLRENLLKHIVGQEEAINQVCDVLYSAWLNPPSRFAAPPSIFITGDCGADIEFATVLAEEIVEVHGISSKPLILNGSLFASHKDVPDLSGMGRDWKFPQKSKLRPVDDAPQLPVCITNAELLHARCLPLFLEAKQGMLCDQYDGKQIDFSRSVFIFASGAGSSSIAEAGDEFNDGVSPERLIERLVSGISDPYHATTVKRIIENCSSSIVLKPMTPVSLKEIAMKEISKEVDRLRNFYRKVELDVDALATVVVESLSSLDPRPIAATISRITQPVRARRYAKGAKAKRNVLQIEVSGVSPFNADRVIDNLAERKHLDFSIKYDCERERLTVVSKGIVCLPALTEGVVRIDTPKDTDTFASLVGIGKPKEYCEKWERFFSGESRVRPEGVLLAGAPGVGKSSFCRALAHELHKPYCVISSRDLSSPEAIEQMFATIRKYSKSGLIVMMDEIDHICGDREGKNEGYCERLGLILAGMDGMCRDNGATLYVGATNRPEALDSAITRPGRLGMTIFFTPLVDHERKRLVEMTAAECNVCIPERLVELAVKVTEGNTPAQIKAIIRQFAMSSDGKEPDEQRLPRARSTIKNGMVTQRSAMTDEERFSAAAHEAGHAIVAHCLGRRYAVVSIESSVSCQGYFEQLSSGIEVSTGEGLLGTMAIALAGRIGSEIMTGKMTDGATSDIEKATKIALRYIKAGFSEEWGLGVPENLEWRDAAPIVKPLLAKQYAFAMEILTKEKPWLECLTLKLLESEVLGQEQVGSLRRANGIILQHPERSR